jgi:hypothetical protein
MTRRSPEQITAQVAVESVVNDFANYDRSDTEAVYATAVKAGVAVFYTDMLGELLGKPKRRETFEIPSSTGIGYDSHTVDIGGHVLEDTHESRDGYPMSVVKSCIGARYMVTVDTNDYN